MTKSVSNLKIGVDARMIDHSGIGVRLYHILSAISKKNELPEIFLFGDPKLLSKYSELSKFKVIPYTAKIYSISELFGHSEMKKMDLLDIPHFNFPIFYLNKCIVTIHDLTPYVMKRFFPSKIKRIYLQIILRLLHYSKKIISVSEYTAGDLEKYFGYPRYKQKVIYNAVDHSIFHKRSIEEIQKFKIKYNLPELYYLSVGIGKGHKNFDFLLDSLRPKYLSGEIKTILVIAGTGGNISQSIQRKLKDIENYIHILPKIPYQELPLLYGGAKCLIYPSLYEGFGLPLIEAQASECPVVSSNASVMPEILRDSALYFDPSNPIDFIDALQNLDRASTELKQKGIKNSRRFQWDQSADELLKVYQDINEVS